MFTNIGNIWHILAGFIVGFTISKTLINHKNKKYAKEYEAQLKKDLKN